MNSPDLPVHTERRAPAIASAEMPRRRVLIVHNEYQQRGGEDSVVEAEAAMLAAHGHEIEIYRQHNNALKTVSMPKAVADTIWSGDSVTGLTSVINRFRPDIVHFHNTFPIISPSAYWAVRDAGLPVIQTLHNFRLHCLQANYLRNETVCEDCKGDIPLRGVVRACYRGSRAQSAVLCGMLAVHRALGTYRHKVTRYIALNEFCRRKFVEGGLPAERIVVKPNFADIAPVSPSARDGFLFVGRLVPEKGISVLLDAWNALNHGSLRVAGTGPLADLFDAVTGVTALGALSATAVRRQMENATALVLPSICYDSFPRTLVESFACCLPVIASRLGPLADLVEEGVTGLLFRAGDSADLAMTLKWARDNPERMAAMGRNARAKYEAEFSAERNYPQLIAIYEDAIHAVARESK